MHVGTFKSGGTHLIEVLRMIKIESGPEGLETEKMGIEPSPSDLIPARFGQHGIPVSATAAKPFSEDENLLHLSHEAGVLEDPLHEAGEDVYSRTAPPESAPDTPGRLALTFKDGVQWELFFDSRTGYLRKMKQPSFRMLNNEISRGPDALHYYYDYRSVEGVIIPHLWLQITEDGTHAFTVEEIELNK